MDTDANGQIHNAKNLYLDILPYNLRQIHHVSAYVTAALAYGLNATLAALLVTEKSKTLAAYRRVLLQNCAVDVLMTTMAFATEMQIDFVDGRTVYVMHSRLRYLSMYWHYVLTTLYDISTCMACLAPTVLFYFRYKLITRDEKLGSWTLAGMLAAITAWSALACPTLTVAFWRNHDGDRVEKCRQLLGAMRVYAGIDLDKCMMTRPNDAFQILFLMSAMITDTFIYSVMSFCALRIFRHLRVTAYSEQAMKLQRHLNRMLICQMVIPLFTILLPVTTMSVIPILNITVPGIGMGVAIMYTLLAVASPLTTILFVASFRQRLVRMVLWRPLGGIMSQRVIGPQVGALTSTSRLTDNTALEP